MKEQKAKSGSAKTDLIEIEDNIPVPEFKETRGITSKYPFRDMNKGQSFFVPMKVPHQISLSYWTAKTGFKFRAVRAQKGGLLGTRVFRIE